MNIAEQKNISFFENGYFIAINKINKQINSDNWFGISCGRNRIYSTTNTDSRHSRFVVETLWQAYPENTFSS